MNTNLTISIETKGKALAMRRSLYDEYLKDIQAEDTRHVLADMLYTLDSDEVNAIKMAYFISTVTDEMGKAEGYKGATDLIGAITGLKTSSISNYRIVGENYYKDEDGAFFMPDCLNGFTVSQLVEAHQGAKKLNKARPAEKVIEDIEKGIINYGMSAKEIRKHYAEENTVVDTIAKVSDVDANEDSLTDETISTTDNGEKVTIALFLVDDTGNRIARITPMNGYTIDGVMAVGCARLEKVEESL